MYKHGVPITDPPEWLNILIVAEEWGTPPWQIQPGYATRRFWLRARNFLKREEQRALKDKSKK